MANLLFYYCLVLVIILTTGSIYSALTISILPLIFFLPVTLYFIGSFLRKATKFKLPRFLKPLSALSLYYGFIVVVIMTFSGLVGAKSIPQLISGVVFLPLSGFFLFRVLPRRKKAIYIPKALLKTKDLEKPKKPLKLKQTATEKLPRIDIDRRQFLKLISSAGLSLFLFSIFAKKAQAAFFGSVPGPGTVALKDTSGVQIDPAIKTPTDGYNISQVDDSTPAYYGFVDKSGNWYIMQEDDTTGNFRYTKGTSGFSTNWTNRATLTYDYFDAVF